MSCCLVPLIFREHKQRESHKKRDDQLNHVHAFYIDLSVCLLIKRSRNHFYIPFILIKQHRQPTDCKMLVVWLLICMQCLQCVRLFLIHTHENGASAYKPNHLMLSAAWILCELKRSDIRQWFGSRTWPLILDSFICCITSHSFAKQSPHNVYKHLIGLVACAMCIWCARAFRSI